MKFTNSTSDPFKIIFNCKPTLQTLLTSFFKYRLKEIFKMVVMVTKSVFKAVLNYFIDISDIL